ncbi:MAG: type II toxin-antitoxin system VapC family toxin [Acidobacteria bacterium]|nr:type II toxin-antitoxin system VapC family toxin [Acidobacteriota bacterium]
MMYLVDANVLSEPTKPAPDPRVVEWLTSHEGQVVVDAVVLGELSVGVLGYPAGRKRAALEAWFESVVQVIDCLPWDAGVSLRWARLVAQLKRKGQSLPLLDSMIAATALHHGLTVVTHNTRDFQRAGVKVFDPFLG